MKQSKHDNGLEKIMKSPGLIIPDKLYWIAKETIFYRDGKNIHCEPDIMAYTRKGDLYILEYKSNDSASNEQKAKHQLTRAKLFVKYLGFNGHIKTMYVGGEI